MIWNSFCPLYYVYRSREYFWVVQVIDNRLGTLIKRALRILSPDVWVHSFFCRRAATKELIHRILTLNLDELHIYKFLFRRFFWNFAVIFSKSIEAYGRNLAKYVSAKFFAKCDFFHKGRSYQKPITWRIFYYSEIKFNNIITKCLLKVILKFHYNRV